MIVYYGISKPDSLEPFLQKIYDYNCENNIAFTFKLWNRTSVKSESGYNDSRLKNLFCFSIKGPFSKVIGYLAWCFLIFKDVLQTKNVQIIYCSRFEVVFSVFIASLVKDIKYVYLDRDAAHLSWRVWPIIGKLIFYIESYIAKKAIVHVIPSEYRNYTKSPNVLLLPNFPSSHLLSDAYQCQTFNHLKILKQAGYKLVYVNGWLVETRGLVFINDFVNKIRSTDNVLILIAADIESHLAYELCKNKYSIYLGRLSPAESLSIYQHVDVVLSFYDPDVSINKVAEPNKWYDCISMNKPFITNHGIKTIEGFTSTGLCKLIDYGDSVALYNLIISDSFTPPVNKLKSIGDDNLTWDSFYKNIIINANGVK